MKRNRAGKLRKLSSFKSLDSFFPITKKEACFKIQIVTLESLETFEEGM